jgi:hypothetical protein
VAVGVFGERVDDLSVLAHCPVRVAVRHYGNPRRGVARYTTNLEVGYALNELTFAVLFLA